MSGIQHFIQTVQRMQWSDYLDIFVVAFLIYNLLPFLKKPNIRKIVRTVGTLVLIAWLTDVMQLHTINWLLSQMLTVGLLAFVVLFQPELRNMLDHLGDMKVAHTFGFTKPVQEMEAIINQTVLACKAMSKEKIGALIVISKANRLDTFFKTGTIINGQVTEQLLRNIFFKNSPLHDGAVLIQNGKIAAAGCVLPLSGNTTLSKELGTRHRAGVGISEVLRHDTVAIIVSEEKGIISVAVDGMLKPHLTAEGLDEMLRKELCPATEGKKSWMEQLVDKISNLRKEAEGE